jgi:hypothetical protein
MLAPEDVLIIGPITECMDTLINSDIYLQGPVIKQGYLKVQGSCQQTTFEHAWVVLRPWSLSVYNSPDDVSAVRGPILIPTSAIFSVSGVDETPGKIELRTIDFSRYQFTISTTQTSNIDHNRAGGGGGAGRNSVQPDGSSVPHDIGTINSLLSDWRRELNSAASRTESLTPYNQGVKKKGDMYSQTIQSIFRGPEQQRREQRARSQSQSSSRPSSPPRNNNNSSNSRSSRSVSSSTTSGGGGSGRGSGVPVTVVMEGRTAGPMVVPIAVAIPIQDGMPQAGLRMPNHK